MSNAPYLKNRKKQKKIRNSILGIALLLIAVLTVGIFTFRNYPNNKEDMALSMNDAYVCDTADSNYIPQAKSLLFHPQNNASDRIPSGKVYYQGENGRLESFINRDNIGIREELTSYDEKGNTVDKLEIGYICDTTRHLKCAVIFKNKISIYETKLSADNKNEDIVIEYLISPQMKFSRGKTYTKL
ncbi:hypothetical protein AGMMS50239_17910 [Bacteroidia bacterium]|nr:hypothetical protein AGMMS50239_17910 [Bacteroidia bacterium]